MAAPSQATPCSASLPVRNAAMPSRGTAGAYWCSIAIRSSRREPVEQVVDALAQRQCGVAERQALAVGGHVTSELTVANPSGR